MLNVVDDKDYGEIQPEELKYVFKPKTQVPCTVKLINKSNLSHMAFKVKTTHPKLYCVRPNVALIKPCETCEIVITRQAQVAMPLPREIEKQKFFIERILLVPEDTTTSISKDNIADIFISEDWKKHINKKKLKVVMTSTDHDGCPIVPVNIEKFGARLGDVEERIRLLEEQKNYCSKTTTAVLMIEGKTTTAVNFQKFAARLDAVEDRLREVQENCCCEIKKKSQHLSFFTRCFNI